MWKQIQKAVLELLMQVNTVEPGWINSRDIALQWLYTDTKGYMVMVALNRPLDNDGEFNCNYDLSMDDWLKVASWMVQDSEVIETFWTDVDATAWDIKVHLENQVLTIKVAAW